VLRGEGGGEGAEEEEEGEGGGEEGEESVCVAAPLIASSVPLIALSILAVCLATPLIASSVPLIACSILAAQFGGRILKSGSCDGDGFDESCDESAARRLAPECSWREEHHNFESHGGCS